ncbi:MAG: hypothetical protein IKP68_12370 [Clostridia bacterium]|nr:hypothetical protein [Clostridia bacterium]
MTPIEKNVKVVDEKGNILEATYPKRAKGLVKNGRARFVDENTICLACPPNKILEDNKMDNINIDKTTGEVTETTVPASKYNLEYALEQIERIANDQKHITEAMDALKSAASNSEATIEQGGTNDKVAEAVAETVKAREATNQKLIEFYLKMVDELKPNAKPEKKIDKSVIDFIQTMYGKVLDTTVDFDDDEARNEAISNITSQMHDLIKQALN